MNQQNISNTPELPVKRKRGRPRKDESMPRNVKQHTQPPLGMAAPPPAMITAFQPPPTAIQPPQTTIIPTTNNINKVDPNMVGQAVTCVIDGIFDNGYLLSTRLGPNNSILRGIVFQQGHVASVTPANDVAPHVEMCTRVDNFPIPPSNPRNSTGIQICTPESVCAKQPVAMQNYQNTPPPAPAAMVTGGCVSSTSAAPQQESLRLVEQDDVMQVFEVNKTVDQQETQDCDQRSKNEHVVVIDPMDESFPENEPVVNESQNERVVNEIQNEPVVDISQNEPVVNKSQNEQQDVKESDGEKPELITSVETVVENQPSMTNDGLPQENQEQTGEVNNVDANQDLNQGVGVDLSLSNFPKFK